jgi:hypothetical protein
MPRFHATYSDADSRAVPVKLRKDGLLPRNLGNSSAFGLQTVNALSLLLELSFSVSINMA